MPDAKWLRRLLKIIFHEVSCLIVRYSYIKCKLHVSNMVYLMQGFVLWKQKVEEVQLKCPNILITNLTVYFKLTVRNGVALENAVENVTCVVKVN